MSDTVVAKFGGSSLADANQFRKVISIIKNNNKIKYVVPSAPGKRFSGDTKVTDMLLNCYEKVLSGGDYESDLEKIRERYNDIIRDLGIDLSLDSELANIATAMRSRAGRDYVASRGEYLSGIVLSHCLDFDFIDASKVIRFANDGSLDMKITDELCTKELENHGKSVIPGFYGSMPNDTIKTFSRGGSDITGAIIARCAHASVYENWTDVSGFMSADPRIVDDPKPISVITYRELRELAYMGATVLHEDSIFPVSEVGIPINIRNTNCPEAKGTMIVAAIDKDDEENSIITGIAGKKGFAVVNIEKERMHFDIGFMHRTFGVFSELGISIEHVPTGIDTMSVIVVDNDNFKNNEKMLIKKLFETLCPDVISVDKNIALVAVVGRGMRSKSGTAAKVFSAIAENNISIRMIDQGSSELNIIVGVDEVNFESAIKAINDTFSDK